MKIGTKLSLLILMTMTACTSVQVTQIDKSYDLTHVCIEENPKVIVREFVGVVVDSFQDHSISTEIYRGEMPNHCEYKLTYTALQSWDISTFLSHAELRLFKENSIIAYAEYHLKGKGGFSLNKWASVESKIKPVVDELLAQY